MVLPWQHLLDAGWRWARSRARKGTGARWRSEGTGAPPRCLLCRAAAAAHTVFPGFICTVQNFVSELENSAHHHAGSKGRKTNIIPGNFLRPLQSQYPIFPRKSAPDLLDPLSLSWGHLHPPQLRAPSLRVVLATPDTERAAEAAAGDAQRWPGVACCPQSSAKRYFFVGGSVNISYRGECAGGIFLILSVHILHYCLHN